MIAICLRRSFASALAAIAFAVAASGSAPAAPPDSSPTLARATGLPESRTAAPSPSPSPLAASPPAAASPPLATASPTPPQQIYVRGQVLSLGGGYLVFTSGQAVKLAGGVRIPEHTPIGIFVRATVDTATHAIVALVFQPKTNLGGEIDAARIPQQYVASSVESLPSIPPAGGSGPLTRRVTVTLHVNVPDNTPQTDDVYVATDRSNFGSAEVRMQRVDLHRWTVEISLDTGTTLRYEYTRGFNTTVERDRSGGILTPRAVTVTDGLSTDDTVQRWSDIQ